MFHYIYPVKTLSLPPEERKKLLVLEKQITDKKAAKRIQVILALDTGHTVKEVAEILLLDEDTVTNIKKKYDKRQFWSDWLADANNGYGGKLTMEQEAVIDQYVQDALITDCRQLIEYIQEKYAVTYSISGVTKLLNRLNFSYKLTVLIPGKLNPEAQKAWLKKHEELKKNLKENEVILFHDGVHPTHNPHKTKAWIKKGEEKQIKTNTGRDRLNINGALDVESMRVITHFSETINADEVIKHYDKIQEAYPDKKTIYIIEDNARYYKNAKVEAYLQVPVCRIKRIFLPTYSPNLNFIERLWKFLKRYIIGVKYREKFKQFDDDIHQFFDNFAQYEKQLRKFIGTELHLVQVTI